MKGIPRDPWHLGGGVEMFNSPKWLQIISFELYDIIAQQDSGHLSTNYSPLMSSDHYYLHLWSVPPHSTPGIMGSILTHALQYGNHVNILQSHGTDVLM